MSLSLWCSTDLQLPRSAYEIVCSSNHLIFAILLRWTVVNRDTEKAYETQSAGFKGNQNYCLPSDHLLCCSWKFQDLEDICHGASSCLVSHPIKQRFLQQQCISTFASIPSQSPATLLTQASLQYTWRSLCQLKVILIRVILFAVIEQSRKFSTTGLI